MTFVKLRNRPAELGFNTLVGDLFQNFPFQLKEGESATFNNRVAPVNIIERDGNYELEVVAPGYVKEDFKINLEKDLLTISAEKKEEAADKNVKYVRNEYKYPSFKRSFHVDETIETTNISAQYVNGVLTLNLPKKEVVKPATKEISVQ